MDNQLNTGGHKLVFTPEEAALLMRLKIFVKMRWLAIAGVVLATLVATKLFGIVFPTLPVYLICVFMFAYNLLLFRQARGLSEEKAGLVIPKVRTYSNIHIILDLVTLTVLLHFTGGIENLFVFLFVLHVIAASIALPYMTAYRLATAAIAMVLLLFGLEYAEVIPHINLVGFAADTLYKQPSQILAVLLALGGILYGAAYMATAISGELRKRQREVVRLREELIEEKTRQVTKLEAEKDRFLRFISIAAHDLKAPLTAIQGYLWIMLGGYSGALTDKQRNILERSTRRINELLKLISDLLDIPRIETGQIVEEMREISLREVIKHSLDDLRGAAKEKGLRLEVEIPQHLSRIHGSSSRLQQVMTNLLSNAINYTPEGTVIVRVTEKSREVQIEVIDCGIGIPSPDLHRLFEDFFRGSNVELKGSGLGLSIARRIVEAHGGRIWAESPCAETGRGTRLYCCLPKKGARRRERHEDNANQHVP